MKYFFCKQVAVSRCHGVSFSSIGAVFPRFRPLSALFLVFFMRLWQGLAGDGKRHSGWNVLEGRLEGRPTKRAWHRDPEGEGAGAAGYVGSIPGLSSDGPKGLGALQSRNGCGRGPP